MGKIGSLVVGEGMFKTKKCVYIVKHALSSCYTSHGFAKHREARKTSKH